MFTFTFTFIPLCARACVLKLARETPTTLDDDGSASVNSDASDTASLSSVSSSSSSLRLSPDSTSLYDVSEPPVLVSKSVTSSTARIHYNIIFMVKIRMYSILHDNIVLMNTFIRTKQHKKRKKEQRKKQQYLA